jgi:pimeloyl-ACP methyl ester carboxylesterase
MQLNKQYFGIKVRTLFSLLALFSFLGCGFDNKFEQAQPFEYQGFKTEESLSKGELASEASEENKEQAVVLVHGLADQGGLNALQKDLLKDFREHNIPVIAFDRSNSQTSSLEQQAQEVFDTLQRQAANKGIVLLGDSQGGVLIALVTLNYGSKLNIKGIITNHSPWEGAPIAALTEQHLNQFMLDPAVNGIAMLLQFMGINLKQLLKDNLASFTHGPGAKDLQPNSLVIQKIKNQLSSIQVPIVAIGGDQTNLTEALLTLLGYGQLGNNPMLGQIGNTLAPAWNQLVGSNNHDFIIPTGSQLAENTPKGTNFKPISIPGYHHYVPLTEPSPYRTIVNAIKEMFNIK